MSWNRQNTPFHKIIDNKHRPYQYVEKASVQHYHYKQLDVSLCMPCTINTTHLLMVVIFSLPDCDLIIDTEHIILA